ncbi:MAG TPA: hypothetical protein VJ783_00550, partial [Pirellulales bacterium]|nr:hypothetical protein [Pirellulales bacterium]
SGCLMGRVRGDLIRADEPRRPSRFVSVSAKQEFEARVREQFPKRRTQSSQTAWLMPIFLFRRETKLSENAYYNDQLASCDADANGFVTDDEVAWYTRPADQDMPTALAQRQPGSKAERRGRIPLAHLSRNVPSDTLASQSPAGQGQNRR